MLMTSRGVLAVWGVKEKRQLCAFRIQDPVTALAVTPDCRRVAVLLDDGVTSRVRVYDVRNIDDIRVDDRSKEKLQQQQTVEAEDKKESQDNEDN